MRLLDGSTLEGGGQLVRIAVALSALTGEPVTINRIRGNRRDSKGLKASHCAAIKFLLEVCGGTAKGNQVGRHEVIFYPRSEQEDADPEVRGTITSLQQLSLSSMHDSPRVTIKPEYDIRLSSPGSVFLIFQALYPYLLFAGACTPTAEAGNALDTGASLKEIRLNITGGTNVSFSPSYDYISQVLSPNFTKLGLPPLSVKLKKRGWASGQWAELGAVSFTISPLSANGTAELDTISSPSHDSGRAQAETPLIIFPSIGLEAFDKGVITQVDVTILAPDTLAQNLLTELSPKVARRRNKDRKLRDKTASYHRAYKHQSPYSGQEEEDEEKNDCHETGDQGYMDDACKMKQGPPQTARDFLKHQTIKTLLKELTRRAGEQSVPVTQGIGAKENEMQPHIDDVVVNLHTSEATSHYSQTYILLVAHTSTGFRLGRDALYSSFHGQSTGDKPKHGKSRKVPKSSEWTSNILERMKGMVDQCVTDLMDEFEGNPGDQGKCGRIILPKRAVDVYMRDQIVVFEALGRLAHPRPCLSTNKGGERDEGEGLSLHTQTARWVCEQMLGC
ncbi:RNA-3'-phosphate cyclase [Arthroderma uncinatum]|uniref:RNA-3'-phosphate cyclase n=1 Tax=Arthroderma uncinatum TaxID=74035 RepID=UPI00144A911D|nr:RNA-3'-phosphate cyclase [Arthroderma uncinatum]KAF3482497.1 RNA-3'-phosphate cyclase [Arthroderma uncinatum]